MSKINAAWHRENRMPRNPTLDQRIAWHLAHAETCGCRPIDGKIADEMKRRRIRIPVFGGSAAKRQDVRPGSGNRRSR